jgi:signal transduction histidine kinase
MLALVPIMAFAIEAGPDAVVSAAGSAQVRVSTLGVSNGGSWTSLPAGGAVRVSSADPHHWFRFQADSPGAMRYRYRLDGRDLDWQSTHNAFRFQVRFLDAVGQLVTSDEHLIEGTSPGWSGALETSTMTPHHEQVTVPPRAVSLRLAFISGGPPGEVGVLAVREVKVTRLAVAGSRQVALLETRFEEGERLDEPNGVPRDWLREGTSGTITQTLMLPGKERRVVLALVDTDVSRWGVWATSRSTQIPVEPGQRLAVEWLGVYSEGSSGPGVAHYTRLPAGWHRFRVQALSVFGKPVGPESTWSLDVRPPFWQASWFWAICGVAVTAAMAWLVRHLTWRHMQRRLELSERKSALEHERARIARDIHDDVGANLTQIALLSELAQADLDDPEQARLHLNQIFTTARALARQLEEIVWAINPANDSLDHLANYLCKFSQEFLSTARLPCRFDVPPTVPRVALTALERHSVFLATKEALHNVVKHAGATEVWLRLAISGDELRIDIEDNGRGIAADAEATRPGQGLANIRQRIEKIGGRVAWRHRPPSGTRVCLAIPVATVKG